jgi:hypothetical protein
MPESSGKLPPAWLQIFSLVAVGALLASVLMSGRAEVSAISGGDIVGDADCSETVDFQDILSFLLSLAGVSTPECEANADSDCDGDTDTADLLIMLAFLGNVPRAVGDCPAVGEPRGEPS